MSRLRVHNYGGSVANARRTLRGEPRRMSRDAACSRNDPRQTIVKLLLIILIINIILKHPAENTEESLAREIGVVAHGSVGRSRGGPADYYY